MPDKTQDRSAVIEAVLDAAMDVAEGLSELGRPAPRLMAALDAFHALPPEPSPESGGAAAMPTREDLIALLSRTVWRDADAADAILALFPTTPPNPSTMECALCNAWPRSIPCGNHDPSTAENPADHFSAGAGDAVARYESDLAMMLKVILASKKNEVRDKHREAAMGLLRRGGHTSLMRGDHLLSAAEAIRKAGGVASSGAFAALDCLVRAGQGDISLCLTEDGDVGAYYGDGAHGIGIGDTVEEAVRALLAAEGGESDEVRAIEDWEING